MNLAISDYDQKKPPKSVFVAVSVILFFLSLSAADSVGFVPYYIDGSAPHDVALSDLPELGSEATQAAAKQTLDDDAVGEKPTRIRISEVNLDLPIQNPETRDIEELDTILQKGPARYVDSALLGKKGNVLIFAHSSRLPVVHNQMYKAFNRVSELESGAIVTLTAGGKEYVYSVTSVRRADAEEELIDLSQTGNRLTLVTCDTLTSKSSRWIAEAELVGSY